MHQILNSAFALVFVFCVIYAMLSDFARLRIPNAISAILLLTFPFYVIVGGVPHYMHHLYLAGVVFILFFVFFVLGWLKAADVKFLTVLVLWAGPANSSSLLLYLALFGSLFAGLLLTLRYALLQHPQIANMPFASKISRLARNGLVPYGLPIGFAALCIAPAIFGRAI